MKRLFLSTTTSALNNISGWQGDLYETLSSEDNDDYDDDEEDEDPGVLYYDPVRKKFAPVPPEGTPCRVFYVSDKDEPGIAVSSEDDYLIYHASTPNAKTLKHFAANRMMASHHFDNPKTSVFAKVIYALRSGLSDAELDKLIDEIFPSGKRAVTLFLCAFEAWPELPAELSCLREEYAALREQCRNGGDSTEIRRLKQAFIQKCIDEQGRL